MTWNILKNHLEPLSENLSPLDVNSYRLAEYRELAERIKTRFPVVEIIIIHAHLLVLRMPPTFAYSVRDEFDCDVVPRE